MKRVISITTYECESNHRSKASILAHPLAEWTTLAELRVLIGMAHGHIISPVRLLAQEGKLETRGGWDDPKGGTFQVRRKQTAKCARRERDAKVAEVRGEKK